MAFREIPYRGFGGGLNLRDKTDSVKLEQAIDCLNVEFTELGSVQQRGGFTEFTGTALTNRVDSLVPHYRTDGSRTLIAGCGTRLETLNTAGAVIGSATGLSGGPWSFARFGPALGEGVYAGNGVDTVRRWDGSAWGAPAQMPRASVLVPQPWDNRMIYAGYTTTTGGPSAAASSPSHVYWSAPGNAEAFTATDNIILTPGDGERITGAAQWRELVFLFKETKFFVFYATSVDSAGIPVFQYRTITVGNAGLVSRRAVTVGTDGVYFMGRDGVYKTTGGEAVLVSNIIDPIWQGGASVFFESSVLNHAQITNSVMGFHDERMYLAFTTGQSTTNDRLLVFDPRYNWWTLWDLKASGLASFRVGDQASLVFGFAAGANEIGRHQPTDQNDNGAAIVSRWRSGWSDFGYTANKRIRQTKLWGTGECDYFLTSDYAQAGALSEHVVFTAGTDTWGDGTGPDTWGDGTGTDTWGPANQVTPVMARTAGRGSVFSMQFKNSGLTKTWSLQFMVQHLAETRAPEVVATER